MMSALAECGTIKTVSQARARIEATRYSPDRPTLSVALGMGYSLNRAWFNASTEYGVAVLKDPDFKRYTKPINVKRGQAIIFLHNTFHGSFSNMSEVNRKVALLSVKSKGCPLSYFHKPEEGEVVEQYSILAEQLLTELAQLLDGKPPSRWLNKREIIPDSIRQSPNEYFKAKYE